MRVDGKSRVDYLADAEPVRWLACKFFGEPPDMWGESLAIVREHVQRAAV